MWNEVADSIEGFDAHTNRAYLPQGRVVQVRQKEGLKLQVGIANWSPALDIGSRNNYSGDPNLLLLNHHRNYLEMLLKTLQMGWMSIIAGPRGSGLFSTPAFFNN